MSVNAGSRRCSTLASARFLARGGVALRVESRNFGAVRDMVASPSLDVLCKVVERTVQTDFVILGRDAVWDVFREMIVTRVPRSCSSTVHVIVMVPANAGSSARGLPPARRVSSGTISR